MDKYFCPECHGPLSSDATDMTCAMCQQSWPISHGIPDFSASEVFFSVFDSEIADKVVELAEAESWSKAIAKYSDTLGAYTARYITDMSRADWFTILPITGESTVLDIGSGWGNIGISLARRAKQVYCGDVNLTNLRLLNTRLREEQIGNIKTFAYDPNIFLKLPFEENSLDIVILNGVLEWMGNNEHPASADTVQVEALKEIRRVLKPGGMLYTGIENRYSVATLKGKGLHGELPFVGLFPRWFSGLVTKLVRGDRHRTYIYSLHGYRRIMKRAGFRKMDFWWPYPSYHNPNYLIPLSPGWVRRFWMEKVLVSRSRKLGVVKSLGLARLPAHWLAFSYSIRCWK